MPSPAVLAQVCDDVAALLNDEDATFSQTFTAVRAYQPDLELGDTDTLTVYVVPQTVETTWLDRSRRQKDYAINVVVLKRFAEASNANLDPLILLVEELDNYLSSSAQRKLSTSGGLFVQSSVPMIYDPDHMKDWNQFSSLIVPIYRMAV